MTRKRPIVGHWTVNGEPACESKLTLGITFTDEHGRESPTFCACTEADFVRMSDALLAVHPSAVCAWHHEKCAGTGSERRDEWEDAT